MEVFFLNKTLCNCFIHLTTVHLANIIQLTLLVQFQNTTLPGASMIKAISVPPCLTLFSSFVIYPRKNPLVTLRSFHFKSFYSDVQFKVQVSSAVPPEKFSVGKGQIIKEQEGLKAKAGAKPWGYSGGSQSHEEENFLRKSCGNFRFLPVVTRD